MEIKKASLVLVLLLVASTFSLGLVFLPKDARAIMLYVGGTGPGNYTTIQSAIDDANPGDTIYVYIGFYPENVRVNKTLSLVGENRETTVIDGGATGDVIYVTADWVNITGFTVTNGGPGSDDAGIELDSAQNCFLNDNNFSGNLSTATILYLSSRNNISYNVISSIGIGIRLYLSDYNTVTDNYISTDYGYGILVDSSIDNTISKNHVSDNWHGVSFWTSSSNDILDNNVSNNWEGIFLSQSSDFNNIIDNTISSSNYSSVLLEGQYNLVYHNKFLNNTGPPFDASGINIWDSGYPKGGNYWSDYMDSDIYRGRNQNIRGSDGIGDNPYFIALNNKDRYPLVSPGIVYPLPPWDAHAILSGRGFENVTIMWRPSPDESGGLIESYAIYRSEDYNVSGSLYVQIGSVANGSYQYVDEFAGEGNSSTYFYIVCSVNMTANSTCADRQVSKFTRRLSVGPNLVSVPLIQSNESIEAVLKTVAFNGAWIYDSFGGEWKSYIEAKPYENSLREVDCAKGFWINVTKESNLTVAGVVPTKTAIRLWSGWNLVGFPSFNSTYTISDLKTAVNSDRVEAFDPSSAPYHLRVPADTEALQAGYGYWVRIGEDAIWDVDV